MPPHSASTLSIQTSEIASPKEALVQFVRALARRQARIDAGLLFDHANDNIPATVH